MSKLKNKYILVPAQCLHTLAQEMLALEAFEERDNILDGGIKWGLLERKCATEKDIEEWRNLTDDEDSNLCWLDAGDEYYDIGTVDEMIERIILKDVQKSAEHAEEDKK